MRPINILIVSHGAFMREIFRYFIQELNMDYDFEKSLFSKSLTNASISCFLFELNSNAKMNASKESLELTELEEMLNVKCLYLNQSKLDD
jgi:broad specificity phosphatase PhoE